MVLGLGGSLISREQTAAAAKPGRILPHLGYGHGGGHGAILEAAVGPPSPVSYELLVLRCGV